MRNYSGCAEIIALTVDQTIAVSDICRNNRLVCRIALQNRQRLAFADAGQNRHIHSSQIIPDIDSSGKYHVRNFQIRYELEAFLGILPVLLPWSHDPELQSSVALFCKGKCLDHRFHILDGCDTKNCTDVHHSRILFGLSRDILKIFHTDSIRCDHRLFHRTAKLNLQLPRVLKQGGNQSSLVVRQL